MSGGMEFFGDVEYDYYAPVGVAREFDEVGQLEVSLTRDRTQLTKQEVRKLRDHLDKVLGED